MQITALIDNDDTVQVVSTLVLITGIIMYRRARVC